MGGVEQVLAQGQWPRVPESCSACPGDLPVPVAGDPSFPLGLPGAHRALGYTPPHLRAHSIHPPPHPRPEVKVMGGRGGEPSSEGCVFAPDLCSLPLLCAQQAGLVQGGG